MSASLTLYGVEDNLKTDTETLARLKRIVERSHPSEWTREAFPGDVSTIRRALALIERYRGALEPFARWAERLTPPNWLPDSCALAVNPGGSAEVTVGHLRTAAALAPDPITEAEVR
jgi:hypothetical protein